MAASVLAFEKSRALRQPPAPSPGGADPDQVRLWLRRVMALGDAVGPFSGARLAEKAGLSPSTVTRFLAARAGMPSLDTLNRIAAAAGVPRPASLLGARDPRALVDVPVVDPLVWRRFGPDAARRQAVAWVRSLGHGTSMLAAARATDDGANAPGVLPGDLAVFAYPLRRGEVEEGGAEEGGAALVWALPGGGCAVAAAAVEGALALGRAVEVRREL